MDDIDLELDLPSMTPGADPLRPQNVSVQNLSLQDIVNEYRNDGDSQSVTMDRFLDDTTDLVGCHISYGGEKPKKSSKHRAA